jgi:hypothetical protein
MTYAYAVVPSPTAAGAAAAVKAFDAEVAVVANGDGVQAVCSATSAVGAGRNRGQRLLQTVLWPQPNSTLANVALRQDVTVAGKTHGCWDLSVNQSATLALGLIIQVRMTDGKALARAAINTSVGGASFGVDSAGGRSQPHADMRYVISAAAPQMEVGSPSIPVAIKLAGIRFGGGAGCNGEFAVVMLNSTGATATLTCTEL